MRRKCLILLLLILITLPIYAQPGVAWERLYGNDERERFYAHIRTEDGGWAFTGLRSHRIRMLYLVKTDEMGEVEFEVTLGDEGDGCTGWDLSQTEDGGYLVGGDWNANNGSGAFGALRMDVNGDLLWERSYGESPRSRCYAVIGSSNDEFYLAGYAQAEENGLQGYVVKIDANGDVIWERFYGGVREEKFWDIDAADFGYVLCGSSSSAGGEDNDFWFVRINPDGDELQSETYGNELNETAYAIKQYPGQGGWALSGQSGPGWPDYYAALLRINRDGIQQWFTDYENDEVFTVAYDFVIMPDGGITAVGYGHEQNIYLGYCFGTDNAGNMMWERLDDVWEGNADFQTAVLDDDGGVTIAGRAKVFSEVGTDLNGWFLKLAAADQPPMLLDKTPSDSVVRLSPGAEETFSVIALDPEGVDLLYRWVSDGDTLGEEDSLVLDFPELDTLGLSVFISDRTWTISTGWEILVVPLIFDWLPEDSELQVEINSVINFNVEAGLPDDTTLTFQWRLDEEIVCEINEFSSIFQELGLFDLTATVRARDVVDSIAWEIEVVDPDIVRETVPSFSKSKLYEPVPNPFNSSVKLSMYLPKTEHVLLSVFDVNGREVSRLVDGDLTAGSQTCVWYAGEFPAGVYVVRMMAESGSEIRKVVLVR